MEYYLAVRMRRYGRTFQPAEPKSGTERMSERSTGRTSAAPSPVGAGIGVGSTVSVVRPVPRSSSREPGRY